MPRSLEIGLFERDALASSDTAASMGDAAKESWIVLKAILEPVVLGREADKHAGRLAVARDKDIFLLRIAEVLGKIVLCLVERDLSHFTHLPLVTSSQPVPSIQPHNREDMNLGTYNIVEDPYVADAQPELGPRDTTQALDAGLRGLGRLVPEVALNGVTDLGPKVGPELPQVANALRGEDDLKGHFWLNYSQNTDLGKPELMGNNQPNDCALSGRRT